MSAYSQLADFIMNGPCGFCKVAKGQPHLEGCPMQPVKVQREATKRRLLERLAQVQEQNLALIERDEEEEPGHLFTFTTKDKSQNLSPYDMTAEQAIIWLDGYITGLQ